MLAGLLVGRAVPDRMSLLAPVVVALVYSSIVVWTNRHDLRTAASAAQRRSA
jgi:hypothetical protein